MANEDRYVKLVAYVPENYSEKVRKSMGAAGAGIVGNYTFCSFSVKGKGRYIPSENSHPTIGEKGKLTTVNEERIETVCQYQKLENIIKAIKKVHPYEEVAIDIYPLLFNPNKITHNFFIKNK